MSLICFLRDVPETPSDSDPKKKKKKKDDDPDRKKKKKDKKKKKVRKYICTHWTDGWKQLWLTQNELS